MTDNTVISDAHARVIRLLEARGLCVQEEIDFPPFRVDIYLPDHHACVEVDGPHHGARADHRRDAELLRVYALPTFRIEVDEIDGLAWLGALNDFLAVVEATKDERWDAVSMKVPWL